MRDLTQIITSNLNSSTAIIVRCCSVFYALLENNFDIMYVPQPQENSVKHGYTIQHTYGLESNNVRIIAK